MTAAVFCAHDARQREHLLDTLSLALAGEGVARYVADNSFEGDATSAYLFSFYAVGWREGFRCARTASATTIPYRPAYVRLHVGRAKR